MPRTATAAPGSPARSSRPADDVVTGALRRDGDVGRPRPRPRAPVPAAGLWAGPGGLAGRIGPGRLLGAVARLERLQVIEHVVGEYQLGRRLLFDNPATAHIPTTTDEP